MFVLVFSLVLVGALNQREKACYIVTTHLSKQPEYDIRNIVDDKAVVINKMKLMNYILYDIYVNCMEKLTNSQMNDALVKEFDKITAKSLGINPDKYRSSDIPDIKTNFLMDLLKFQTDPNEL
jgi:hypothetical protein